MLDLNSDYVISAEDFDRLNEVSDEEQKGEERASARWRYSRTHKITELVQFKKEFFFNFVSSTVVEINFLATFQTQFAFFLAKKI